MFLKKKLTQSEKSDVRFINGIVTLGGVRLNVYCFETDGVLIDTGSENLLKLFQPFFTQVDIDQVIITHFHEDHTGGAAYLQQQLNMPIYMNKMSINDCTQKADYPLYRKIFWGKRAPFQAEPIDTTFQSRNTTWKAIETPGHAADHLAYLNEQTGQLFSGDLFVHPKTKLVLREESIPTIIQSIEKILTYDFAEMFCCHAGYVKDGKSAFKKKLTYLKELEFNVLELYKQGYSNKEIRQTVFPKKYPIMYVSFGEWDSIHMINSIIQHALSIKKTNLQH